MGINFNRVGDDYATQKGLEKACFVNPDGDENVTAQQAEVQEPVVKKSEEDSEKGLKVQTNPADEDPVEAYNKKAQEIVKQSEQTLRNLGIEPKKDVTKLHITNPFEVKEPETEEEIRSAYRQMKINGQTDMTEEEIIEMAKRKAEDNGRKAKINNTHVFINKGEYDQAQAEKTKYIKQLRSDDLSKEDAQAEADDKFGVNNYLHGGLFGSKARRFIEKHPELFNENGKFSDQKLKDFVVKMANYMNGKNDDTSHYLSLNERRAFKEFLSNGKNDISEESIKVSVDTLGKLAKAVGMEKEYNPTFWMRAGAVVLAAGIGAVIGAATGGSVAFGVFNECGQLCNGVIVPGEAVGAVAGAVVGGATTPFLAAKGKEEQQVLKIKQQVPPIQLPPAQVVPPEEVVPPKKPCPPQYEDAFCNSKDYGEKIKYGDNWNSLTMAKVKSINGVKIADSDRNAKANAYRKAYIKGLQLQYNLTSQDMKQGKFLKVGDYYKMYETFDNILTEENLKKYPQLALLKDATIELNCNAPSKPDRVEKGNFGLVTNSGRNVRNEYDCYGNLVKVEEY